MLPDGRSFDLWKRILLKSSKILVFNFPSFPCKMSSSSRRKKNDVLLFSFAFHIFKQLTSCFIIPLHGIVSHPSHPPSEKDVDTYRQRKIRRNVLTTNPLQGEVQCCQIWGRPRKREENHMSGP